MATVPMFISEKTETSATVFQLSNNDILIEITDLKNDQSITIQLTKCDAHNLIERIKFLIEQVNGRG
jgi:hypothetical protein